MYTLHPPPLPLSLLPVACGAAVGALSPLRARRMLDVVRCMPHYLSRSGTAYTTASTVKLTAAGAPPALGAGPMSAVTVSPSNSPMRSRSVVGPAASAYLHEARRRPESRLHARRPAGRWSGNKAPSNEVGLARPHI